MNAFDKPMEKEHLLLTRKSIARLHKKNRNWIEAIPIYKQLAEDGEWDACEELAKYYEHTGKDFVEARRFASLGLENCDRSDLTEFQKNRIQSDFHHRILRLEGLLGKDAAD
jgi:hypothetical protein